VARERSVLDEVEELENSREMHGERHTASRHRFFFGVLRPPKSGTRTAWRGRLERSGVQTPRRVRHPPSRPPAFAWTNDA